MRWVLFASPQYLKKRGLPQQPADLANHLLIQSLSVETASEWPFQENGKPRVIRIEPRLRMNTNDAVAELVARGWGISRLLSYQIAPHLADGRVQTVLREFEMPPLPIHVVHQEGRMVSTKVRAFVDYMVDRLRADPAINWICRAGPFEGRCHVWTPPVLQGENLFEVAVELAVMYPALSLRYADRWP